MAKKRRHFACRSCLKITSTTNEKVYNRRLCFKCRLFKDYDKIVGEMVP